MGRAKSFIAAAAVMIQIILPGAAPVPQNSSVFGSAAKIPSSLQGDIYLLPEGAQKLPDDFSKMKSIGQLYASQLNIPSQNFNGGFAGAPGRSAWFALNYHGNFAVAAAGIYNFRLTADDGAKLYIDNKLLIDNDGQHGPQAKEAAVQLTRGIHAISVPYFQAISGLTLVLEAGRDCGPYAVLNTANFAPPPLPQLNAAAAASAQGVFGSATKIPFSLQGDIYGLSDGTGKLPDDFSKTPCIGRIYATQLNVPTRSFTEGFPGVTNRFEWFAINYHGTMMVPQDGKYNFKLTSDDGSKLYIDDKLLIDNDGTHATQSKEGSVQLTRGVHSIRVPYFQGPRVEIALVLEVARDGGAYQPFKTDNFAPAQVSSQNGTTKVTLGEAILFDFDKSNLKPGVDGVLAEVKSSVIDQKPNGRILIAGYTDDVGADAYNLALSDRRAQSVADWLQRAGIQTSRITTKGYGKTQPVVPNTSDANRARNRRVEISVQ